MNSDLEKRAAIGEAEVLEHLKSRPLPVVRVAKFITNRYGQLIDMADQATKRLEDRIDHFLTRALAAHSVAAFTGFEPKDAADCVVDGGQDLGIDAIAIDESQKRVWVVQSKFQHSGRGLIQWSEAAKFLEGFHALVSDDFAQANPKILRFENEIRIAATDPGWRFTLVLASTSEKPLSDDSVDDIKSKLAYSDPGNTGTFRFENFPLAAQLDSIQHSFDATKITLLTSAL